MLTAGTSGSSKRLEVKQLIDGAGLCNPLLMDETSDGDHSESSVHNLISLILFESSWFLSKTEGIEAEVSRLRLTLNSLLELVAAESLKQDDEHHDLAHTTGIDIIVMCINREHVREIRMREGEKLLNDHAQGGEHANSAVLDLSFL